jgi:hypothetical protein
LLKLSVVVLVVVRLNVSMLGVVVLNVVAPVKEIEDINDRNDDKKSSQLVF